jgi:hypothetical protein
MSEQSKTSNSGSRWLRWDPHVHAPGTVLNDQFKGDWNAYLQQLEDAVPAIKAIGVTDYYSTDVYERVLEEKQKGRLPDHGFARYLPISSPQRR